MLAGPVRRGYVPLKSKSGVVHHVSVIDPDHTPANRAELLRTEKEWGQQAIALSHQGQYDAARRAKAAADWLFLAAAAMTQPRDREHLALIAQETSGVIRGLCLFRLDRQNWELDLFSVDPPDQRGNPNPDPIRGIGPVLLGEVARYMEETLCATVYLEPLDDEALHYWISRGFTPAPGRPGHYAMPCGSLRALADRCGHAPGDPEDMLCNRRAQRALVSLHA